jgi:hypothetical protein
MLRQSGAETPPRRIQVNIRVLSATGAALSSAKQMDGLWPDWAGRIDFSSFQEIHDRQNNSAGIGKADPALGHHPDCQPGGRRSDNRFHAGMICGDLSHRR